MDDGAIINDAGKHNVNKLELVSLNGPVGRVRFEIVAGMETEN
jgi:hypothetical protein